jgi:hypothetical protein
MFRSACPGEIYGPFAAKLRTNHEWTNFASLGSPFLPQVAEAGLPGSGGGMTFLALIAASVETAAADQN